MWHFKTILKAILVNNWNEYTGHFRHIYLVKGLFSFTIPNSITYY